jgi:hypothetical protein
VALVVAAVALHRERVVPVRVGPNRRAQGVEVPSRP